MAIAFVTGATSGIGKAIAVKLKSLGYDVVGAGRDRSKLNDLKTIYDINGIQINFDDLSDLERKLDGLAPDVLINNAGMMPPLSPFCDANFLDIQRTLNTNLTATLALTHILAPRMRSKQNGHIIFTGSTAGHSPFPNLAAYCASKFAISGFARALQLELASSNIRVTEIVAGRVETNLYSEIVNDETRAAMYANQSAVQPNDIAEMVSAVLKMPSYVDVTRFDIIPTKQSVSTGSKK